MFFFVTKTRHDLYFPQHRLRLNHIWRAQINSLQDSTPLTSLDVAPLCVGVCVNIAGVANDNRISYSECSTCHDLYFLNRIFIWGYIIYDGYNQLSTRFHTFNITRCRSTVCRSMCNLSLCSSWCPFEVVIHLISFVSRTLITIYLILNIWLSTPYTHFTMNESQILPQIVVIFKRILQITVEYLRQ